MILVSRNIRLVRIFARVQWGAPNDSGILENGDAQTFPSKFPTLKSTLYSNTVTQPLVDCPVIPKCVTLNDLYT